MKRQLLSLLVLAMAITAFGQGNKTLQEYDMRKEMAKYDQGTPVLGNTSFPTPLKTSATPIGTSYNVYSILRDAQNQVNYNKDLDAVSFVHRQNAGLPGGSGLLSFDISTDGGTTWDTTTKVLTPSVGNGTWNGARYPSGVIWNPAGNTDPNNAWMMANGPMLNAFTGSWGFEFLAYSKLDGTAVSENYYTTPDTNSLIPGGFTINPNGDMFSVDLWDNNSSISVGKYTFDGSAHTANFTYLALDTAGSPGGSPTVNSQMNIAFAPDGLTGYVLASASDALYGTLSMKLQLWKTMDGGATWNKMPTLDYATMPDLIDATVVSSDSAARPWMRDYDMVVDSLGELHVIANMGSGSNPADPGFIWVSTFSTNTVWRFKTDGTTWESELLDPWLNTWGDIGGDGSRWFGPRPQAARAADGSAVFLNWAKTDTLLWQVTANLVPDVWSWGYGVGADGKDTIKNLTAGTEAEAQAKWATVAPIMVETGSDHDMEFAMVYGEDQGAALSPIQYYYAKGFGFDATELFNTVISTDPTRELEANIKVFPNPTSGMLNIDLRDVENAVNVDIVNMMGQTVMSLTEQRNLVNVNLEGAAGIYLVRITDGAKTTTRKVILAK